MPNLLPDIPSQRILTGIQSTGIPHAGNILGAILPAIAHAQKNDTRSFFFIADLHALTSQPNPADLKKFTYATAAAWLAFGLDLKKNLLYRQSRIPEVCELAWYFNCMTSYPLLAKAHAFKEKSNNLKAVTAGLFTYPVLMAADILLYQATHVPVGQDQQQHLEIARDIAKRFNSKYAPLFVLPEAIISKEPLLPGTDGRKMSKSYHNTINLFASESELTKTIMRIPTATTPVGAPINPDTCTIFQLYQSIAPNKTEVHTMRQSYQAGTCNYLQAKEKLLHTILETFATQRQAFTHYIHDTQTIEVHLQHAEASAREVAHNTLIQVRQRLFL